MATRSEREAELFQFMQTKAGQSYIHDQWRKVKRIPLGQLAPPVGTLMSSMIQDILDAEFPGVPRQAPPESDSVVE